ncbi:MAG: universal stress protein [Bacteroidota bacterium]|nr:universal stress protein [Bacteroidota bacterium]
MTKRLNLLVPTDFSVASRAGIRFAIQLAGQQNAHITFVHVLTLFRRHNWSDRQFEAFAATERRCRKEQLETLVADVRRRHPLRPGATSTLVLEGLSADLALIDYCQRHPDIDLICMGTRGASKVNKLFGTNTGNLITHSDTPVIAVPALYRKKEISRLLYITDLIHGQEELKEVVALAKPLHARLSVLHLMQPGELNFDTRLLQKVWKKEFGYPVDVDFRPANSNITVVADLEQTIRRLRPSLVVMFSNRRRTLFEAIFYPSHAERLSFRTRTPILVMGKNDPNGVQDRPKEEESVMRSDLRTKSRSRGRQPATRLKARQS